MNNHSHYLLFICIVTFFVCGAINWQTDGKTSFASPVQPPASYIISYSANSPNLQNTEPPYNWMTFIGSDKWDLSYGAELDAGGNLYVVTNHYLSEGGSYGEGDENEISITKIANKGKIEWRIPVNAEPYSWSESVTLDSGGNLYISGTSLESWGNPLNPYPGADPGQVLFIAKYRTSDGSILWNTFLGSNLRGISSITADENNNIYAVWTQDNQDETRAYFLAKLNNAGILQWSKVIISSEGDSDRGFRVDVRIDKDGNIYVLSTNITNWGEPIRELSGGFDVSVAKFDNSGILLWNTFLGGTGGDISSKVIIDENGFLYVSGYSETTWGNPINLFQQGTDGFLTKLDTEGTLLWNTFVGGAAGLDYIFDMEMGTDGNLYLVGSSESTWGNPVNVFTAGLDGFVAQFDPNGSLLWNAFIGGSGNEGLRSIAIDASGALRVTGFSSESFGNPINPALGGGNDIFATSMIIPSASQAAFRDPGQLVPVLTTYIPTPLDISTDPSVIGTNVLFAILMLLPFAVSVDFFSQIISENEENLMRWVPPLAWIRNLQNRSKGLVKEGSNQNLLDVLGLFGVALFYGIVFSLLDETWQPFTAQGLVLLGSMTFSCGVIGFLSDILQWRALRKWEIPAEYNLRATSIFLSAISVGISRSLTLLPGLMFGYPEVLKVDERSLNERQNQSLAKISSTTYLVVALGAWLPTIVTTMIQRGPISDATREIIGGVEAFLLVIFAVALEALFLQLLALSEGLGTKLKRFNRWVWGISLALCIFAFLHTLLNPRYDLVQALEQSNTTLFIGVAIVFIVITFILRWVSRKRKNL
jgi:hypothetical protein